VVALLPLRPVQAWCRNIGGKCIERKERQVNALLPLRPVQTGVGILVGSTMREEGGKWVLCCLSGQCTQVQEYWWEMHGEKRESGGCFLPLRLVQAGVGILVGNG